MRDTEPIHLLKQALILFAARLLPRNHIDGTIKYGFTPARNLPGQNTLAQDTCRNVTNPRGLCLAITVFGTTTRGRLFDAIPRITDRGNTRFFADATVQVVDATISNRLALA